VSDRDIYELPAALPIPEDDGAADHLAGMQLPNIGLLGTNGAIVNLSHATAVIFGYPRTGVPGKPPLVLDWDLIPGARGCTPQVCGFRDLVADFEARACDVYGISTQTPEYQLEAARRLKLRFPLLSDSEGKLVDALKLPTFEVRAKKLLKRISLVAVDGKIVKVFYPVFPPDQNARNVLEWLDSTGIVKRT
jgi:peroxiredoxin